MGVRVATLDEQPVISSARTYGSSFDLDQCVPAAQFLAQQRNMDLAVSQLFLWRLIFRWLILSKVPDHHRSGSVLARRNHTLEFRIFERMVLRPYGQALVRRVHRKSFGYCPGCQDAIYGQPKIIMKPTGIVFLNDKDAAATTSPHSPDWFGRFSKISIASICCERHCVALDCFGVSSAGLEISPHSKSALTHDIFWPLVIPQAEESRVSQLASRRPLCESDLSDELRFHPVHAASRQPVLGKGRNRRLQPCELLAQTP